MILIPMQNARQRRILNQLLKRQSHPLRVHSNTFSSIADSQHRHSLSRDETPFPQGLQGVAAAVVLCYHAEAGGAAVHGV